MHIMPVTVGLGEAEPFVPEGATLVTVGERPNAYRSLVCQVLPPHLSNDQRLQDQYRSAAGEKRFYADSEGAVYTQTSWKFVCDAVPDGRGNYELYLVEWKRHSDEGGEPLQQLVAVIPAQGPKDTALAFDLLQHANATWESVLTRSVVEYLPQLIERLRRLT